MGIHLISAQYLKIFQINYLSMAKQKNKIPIYGSIQKHSYSFFFLVIQFYIFSQNKTSINILKGYIHGIKSLGVCI